MTQDPWANAPQQQADPFATPAPPGGSVDFNVLNNCLLMFEVHRVEDHVPTVHTKPGEKSPAVAATVHIIDGPMAGQVIDSALIFPKILQSQLSPRVGAKVLGRLFQGQGKPGQSPPWTLAEATPQDRAAALEYLNRLQSGQMQAPAQQPPAQQQQYAQPQQQLPPQQYQAPPPAQQPPPMQQPPSQQPQQQQPQYPQAPPPADPNAGYGQPPY